MNRDGVKLPQATRRRAAYLFGHFTARFRATVQSFWQRADGKEHVPDHLAEDVVLIEQSSRELLQAIRGARRVAAERAREGLVSAIREVILLVRAEWNGDDHSAGIRHRDHAHEILSYLPEEPHDELDPWDRLAGTTVLTTPLWATITEKAAAFGASLPNSLHPLFALGRCTVLAFDEELDDEEFASRLAQLQHCLAEGEDDPLVSALRLAISARSMHQENSRQARRAWIRSQVWRLHQDVYDGLHFDNTVVAGLTGTPGKRLTGKQRLAMGIGLLAIDPAMTVSEVVREARLNRSSLYRNKVFKIISASRKAAKSTDKTKGRYTRGRDGEWQLDGEFDNEDED